MGHIYNCEFYDYINAGSRQSARVVIPLVRSALSVHSVLDIGAGQGAWAAEWAAAGLDDVVGVDGDYVDDRALLIAGDRFVRHDLSRPLQLGRTFDLVQSLEVAEHIPEANADIFVDTLTAHGDIILFSAATPNQGGEHHINEQPLEYWRRKFADRGYTPFDWLRPHLRDASEVKPWYRYNTLLYANAQGTTRLPEPVRATKIAEDTPVAHTGSLAWQARRAIIAMLPQAVIGKAAMANASWKARGVRNRPA